LSKSGSKSLPPFDWLCSLGLGGAITFVKPTVKATTISIPIAISIWTDQTIVKNGGQAKYTAFEKLLAAMKIYQHRLKSKGFDAVKVKGLKGRK
ncbi:MAG: hypothetical protein R6V21_12925, partial [Pelovirga sp.]